VGDRPYRIQPDQELGEPALPFDLDQAVQGDPPLMQTDDPNLLKLTVIYHNLLRGWSRT
jgi:PKHD-type hydroxylase